MLESFLIVGTQVLILFILISLGFLGGKLKLINDDGIKSMNNIMLYLVTPCVIIEAFQKPFDKELFRNLLLALLAALIAHVLSFLLGKLFIKDKDESRRVVLRFSVVFCNCGFMALPLVKALLGSEGVFYASAYIAIFNILVWSFGQYAMAGNENSFNIRKAFLNPGLIGVVIGLIFFFTSYELPYIVIQPISFMSATNTPIPMLMIGYSISKLDFKEIVGIKKETVCLILRLVVSPLLLLGVLYGLGYRGILLTTLIVSASTPVAATTTMFSIKFNKDEKLSSKMVAVSTLFSIITMTLIVGFTQYIA